MCCVRTYDSHHHPNPPKHPQHTNKAHNYGLYVLLAWLPTYFSQTYGLDLKASSTMAVAPWVAAAVVSNLAGCDDRGGGGVVLRKGGRGWLGGWLVGGEGREKRRACLTFNLTHIAITTMANDDDSWGADALINKGTLSKVRRRTSLVFLCLLFDVLYPAHHLPIASGRGCHHPINRLSHLIPALPPSTHPPRCRRRRQTDVRKLFQCTALLVPACCMTALALGGHTPSEAQVRVCVGSYFVYTLFWGGGNRRPFGCPPTTHHQPAPLPHTPQPTQHHQQQQQTTRPFSRCRWRRAPCRARGSPPPRRTSPTSTSACTCSFVPFLLFLSLSLFFASLVCTRRGWGRAGGRKRGISATIVLIYFLTPHTNPPPDHSTYGASSALSVIVGSLGTFGTGVILDQTHDWTWVYGGAAGVYVAGALLFAGMYKAHKIFD